MTMSSIAQETALDTLDSLEQRLQRLRFLLYASPADAPLAAPSDTTPADHLPSASQAQSIASRLQALQSSFNSLLSDSKPARDIVTLRALPLPWPPILSSLTLSLPQNHNINMPLPT